MLGMLLSGPLGRRWDTDPAAAFAASENGIRPLNHIDPHNKVRNCVMASHAGAAVDGLASTAATTGHPAGSTLQVDQVARCTPWRSRPVALHTVNTLNSCIHTRLQILQ